MNVLFLHNFQRPWIFILLSLILLIVILFIVRRPKNSNFIDTSLIQQVYKTSSLWQSVFWGSISIVIFACIAMLSGLFSNIEKQVVTKEGIDIQIVLDMSYSMIAEDIKPRRIDVAKEMIHNFIGEIYSDRVGIILFSGKPFQSVPLTFDYNFLQEFTSKISVDIVSQSTNVELAGTAL
jgi:Ca-activated chloride channel family protein